MRTDKASKPGNKFKDNKAAIFFILCNAGVVFEEKFQSRIIMNYRALVNYCSLELKLQFMFASALFLRCIVLRKHRAGLYSRSQI